MGIQKNGATPRKKTTRKKSSANKNQPTKKGLKRQGNNKPTRTRKVRPAPETNGTIEERWNRVLKAAEASGHFMFVLFHLNGDQVRCYRRTNAFPPEDFETALDLLEADLTKEKESLQPKGRAKVAAKIIDED